MDWDNENLPTRWPRMTERANPSPKGDRLASREHQRLLSAHEPAFYQIRVSGRLDSHWSEWFDGLTITYSESGYTNITGLIQDQAALYGILTRIRDLGLPLLAVNLVPATKRT
jgi:hypothetical protein